ncbi:hypothetical protein FF38_03382 [Lucilia cuprina]|uniref:OAR domain-containing protein n=1 Tax=Lucilia cuprina TaxID=7375 RepID=A0A0L0C2H3_LUCCU|nr:hypothetical protein FF38_03382 [Lucilia cuprina]
MTTCHEGNNSIACLRAKAQEHQARLLNSGLFLQVRSFADLQQQHQQHLNKTHNNLQNNIKNCDVKALIKQQTDKILEKQEENDEKTDNKNKT